MNKKPLISICILNTGAERLKKCLPSIMSQNYSKKEILIMDNNSSPESIKFLKKHKGIKVIKRTNNLPYGRAKNILVKKAKGDYILLLDNDIELPTKDFLKKIYSDYKSQHHTAFITVPVLDIGKKYTEGLGLSYNHLQKRKPLSEIYQKGVFPVGGFNGNVVFFRRKDFLDLGGFDEIYPFNIDDYDLSARAYNYGFNNYIDTNIFVHHHGIETRSELAPLCWKEKYYFAGFSRMMLKNYRAKNLFIYFIPSVLWIIYKNLKICFGYRSVRPFLSLITSLFLSLKNLKNTLEERKKLFIRRVRRKDIFLETPIPLS